MGEAAELLRTLVKMELVVQASFEIMRLLASSRMTFCSVLFAKITARVTEDFKVFQRPPTIEWSLAPMIAAGGGSQGGTGEPREGGEWYRSVQVAKAVGAGSAESGPPSDPRGGGWPHKPCRYSGSGLRGMPSPIIVVGRIMAASGREALAGLVTEPKKFAELAKES